MVLSSSGGGGQQRQAAGHGREAHAQLVPQEHVRAYRGDKKSVTLHEPVSVQLHLCLFVEHFVLVTAREEAWPRTPGWR